MGAHSDRLPLERELAAAPQGAGPATRVCARAPEADGADAADVERALHRIYPGLVGLLVRRVGDPQLAQDLLHDAIVTTLGKLAGGTSLPPEALAGYVFRTALNHLLNHRRHARLAGADGEAAEALPADPASGPVEQAQREGLRELVRRVLQDLSSSRDRELLVRYYLDEEDKPQLCESLALSGAQFDRVICRARERLRTLLGRSGLRHLDLLVVALLLLLRGASEGA